MSDLNELLIEKPWAREYLFFDPDLQESAVVFDENLTKFKAFIQSMEEVRENSDHLLKQYGLPDHKAVIELLAVFKLSTTFGPTTVEQQELFFDFLSAFIKSETEKGKSLDEIFADKDALALARLYQVKEEKWNLKYLTWILYELGAIDKKKGPDVFGANDSAFQTYDFLKNASDGNWRPQMHFSGRV